MNSEHIKQYLDDFNLSGLDDFEVKIYRKFKEKYNKRISLILMATSEVKRDLSWCLYELKALLSYYDVNIKDYE